MAQRAYDKALYKTAANLWSDSLEANSKLADDRQAQHRYNAACAAVLAGCNNGKKDDGPPTDDEKPRTRKTATSTSVATASARPKVRDLTGDDTRR